MYCNVHLCNILDPICFGVTVVLNRMRGCDHQMDRIAAQYTCLQNAWTSEACSAQRDFR